MGSHPDDTSPRLFPSRCEEGLLLLFNAVAYVVTGAYYNTFCGN
jgi:hypothetical protein